MLSNLNDNNLQDFTELYRRESERYLYDQSLIFQLGGQESVSKLAEEIASYLMRIFNFSMG